jgi:alpha-ketoglutarate-dependent taurine dioxygenase
MSGHETVAAVRQALTDHKVLFFSGQQLDPDSQVALGNRMGRLTVSHPVDEPVGVDVVVTTVDKKDATAVAKEWLAANPQKVQQWLAA